MNALFVKQTWSHWNICFIYANSLNKLWDDLYAWLSLKYVIPDFDFKTVKYLSFCRNCDVELLINTIVILANYFIHKYS